MEKLPADEFGKAAVLEALAALYPWTSHFHSRPVRDYAHRLFQAPAPRSMPEIRLRAFAKLLDILERSARRSGLSTDTAVQLRRDFEKRPVLQTGPHLLLLIEPEAYYTHVFSLLGLAAHDCSTYVSYAVSTVSLVERPRKGPGWLAVGEKPVNVFGLSRSRMVGYSLLSGPGSYRFELVPAEASAEGDALARLRSLLPTAQFERPAHAIKAANLMLWPKAFGSRFAFVQIDDEDVTDLVADHLSADDSWLRARLLEHPTLASSILAGLDNLAAGPWGGWLARRTDFFWLYENGKRLPLRLVAGTLVHPANGMKVARFTASEILERLQDRSLIPNLLLAFLVLSVLPGVRVLGGSHQPVYYPLIRYVVSKALEAAGVDRDLRDALNTDDVPGAWGHRILEFDGDPCELLRGGAEDGINDFINGLGKISLNKACGTMSSFVSDPFWRELHGRLRNGVIAPDDAEWVFS